MFRVGFSKDVHNLVDGVQMKLGSVAIPSDKKIEAYSDGDIIWHVIAESIYGALGKDDLGSYYSSENMNQNFSSEIMVKESLSLAINMGYKINNIDIMIVVDKPNLKKYKYNIKKNIADILLIDESLVAVKATTTEGNNLNCIEAYSNVSLRKED